MTDSFLRYWGKTSDDYHYHLLPYHCLDVAAVGFLLLDPSEKLCQRLSASLAVPPHWLQKWFTFCLSLHDIGKFATAFQGQAPNLSPDLVPPNRRMEYTERHDTLGFMLWRDVIAMKWLEAGGLGFIPEQKEGRKYLHALDSWLEIVTGHHGTPPKINASRRQKFFTEPDEQAGLRYCLAVSGMFLGDLDLALLIDKQFRQSMKPHSWLLAGIMVLADWLGSSIEVSEFYKTPLDLAQYWQDRALPQASRLLDKAALSPAGVSPFRGTSHLFPFITDLTPLQEWAVSAELSDRPQLFILEDLTGAGKTEAALTLAHRLMAKGLADGLYVALPTMATANAMYRRIGKAYRRLFEPDQEKRPSLILAHGARRLSEDFRLSVGLSESNQKRKYAPDEECGETYCSAWLADSRKKALLADVGVGTVDQALLGVLPARHQSLRLLGLSRKILIVDEVHAYDPYMNQLLKTLLEAHARNGGSAILLSATLPQAMREDYAEAFCTGADLENSGLDADAPYPLITHIGSLLESETHVHTREETGRTFRVVMIEEIEQVEKILQQAVAKGQCACWIRNTVGDARSAYGLLAVKQWMDKTKLSLFHSRFAMVDRNRIESGTLDHFGKDSGADDRSGRVLVATQVVEQSLDLDFDILISDLAPIDLLIQRAGRMHRHIRDEAGNRLPGKNTADKRGEPVLYVYGPPLSDAPQADWLRSVLPGTQAVYPHAGQLWLTQRHLKEAEIVKLPEAARWLIEGVYGDNAQHEIPEALQDLSFDAEGADSCKRGMARLNALKLTKGYTRTSSEDVNGWDEDIRIPTRLSDETVTVALARIEDGELKPYAQEKEFAWELSMLSLPQRDWRNVAETIPEDLTAKIDQLKENERILKWAEVLPLSAETKPYYHSRMGWGLTKEDADELD